jgi:uncharacterized membrane protein
MVFNKKIKYAVSFLIFFVLVLSIPSFIALCSFIYYGEASKTGASESLENPNYLYKNVHDFLVWQKPLSKEFTENELSHMRDVRFLFNSFRLITLLFLLFLLIYFVLETQRIKKLKGSKLRKEKKLFLEKKTFFIKTTKQASIFSLIFLVLLVLFVLLNFNFSFDVFHRIFFPQGNWIFPHDSLLITLFPSEFFFSMASKILLITFSVVLLIILALSVVEKRLLKMNI